jgi:hypothetical protein
MPAVNFDRMFQAFAALGGDFNQVLYWSRLADSKNQSLTPNPDTVYFMAFFDLTGGPIVIEIPAADGGSFTGSIMDSWQCALADVGPAGADKGVGGKYVIVPPSYGDSEIPDRYIALYCKTLRGYALLRSNVNSGKDSDVADGVAYGQRVKVHRLPGTGEATGTRFVDAAGQLFDSRIPYDSTYFDSLNRFVQAEPWLGRDKAMIQALATVGVVKGQPFAPGAEEKLTLDDAAQRARWYLGARYETFFDPPYLPGTHWALPVPPPVIEGQQSGYDDPNSYPVDDRGTVFTFAFFSAKHFGGGQFYLMAIHDAKGHSFDGAKSYRLTVPTGAPVTLYWSVTVYDRQTHALIADAPRSSRASNSEGLQVNPDDSVDIHLGPQAPDDAESNWIPTDPESEFEVLIRFYGPTPALFEKTWPLPDIEPLA